MTNIVQKNRKKVFNPHPWITNKLKRLRNKKDWLKGQINTSANPNEATANYNRTRNKLNREIRCAKIAYYREAVNDGHNIHKIFKSLLNQSSKGHVTPTESGSVFLNNFNKFFATIGQTEKIHDASSISHIRPQPQSMFAAPTNNAEVSNTIDRLNQKSAVGVDEVSPLVLKVAKSTIVPYLTFLINRSLLDGTFPQCFKIARVTPIHKGGDVNVFGNYRPISILSILSKILERIMHTRLTSFITKFNILYSSQYGFRPGHSTADALLEVTEAIRTSLNNKKQPLSIMLDFRKAFDTVNHKMLLMKLERYGIRGNILSFIRSYLSNRTQVLSLHNANSQPHVVGSGVPQGSILGPLLFLLYINDLPSVCTVVKPTIFADDTCLNGGHSNEQSTIQLDLREVDTWLSTNCMSANPKNAKQFILEEDHIKTPCVLPVRFWKIRLLWNT